MRRVCPFLSVIIVTYNSQDFIGDCLKSVERAGEKAHQYLNLKADRFWETIVVDNASRDKTREVVSRFENVRLICNEVNRGFAAGINAGAKEARGQWLLLLNPDCVLDEKAFIALYEFVQNSDGDVAVIGLRLLNPDGTLQPSGRKLPKVWEFVLALLGFHRLMEARWFAGRDFSAVQEVEEVSGAALAIRREVFEKVGGMDEGFFLFFEELDLCRRVKEAGWKVVSLPEAKVKHLWGASVKRVPNIARRAQCQSAFRYFRKHHGLAAAILVSIAFSFRNLVHKIRSPGAKLH